MPSPRPGEKTARAVRGKIFGPPTYEADMLHHATLSELAVNRQDPDFISREVDSVAASIQSTEAAMEELQLVDGLLEGLTEAPPILDADLKEVLGET